MHATVPHPRPRQRLRTRAGLALCYALAAACLLALPASPAGARDAATAWGKRMVETFELTSDDLARLARHQDKTAGQKPAGFFSETVSWKAPRALDLPASGNPYTLVVHVAGVAQADGEGLTRWMAGWETENGARLSMVQGVSFGQGTRGGQVLQLAGTAGPVSFKEDREVVPVLEFAGASNLRLDGVRVEVWSGMRRSSFVELLMSAVPLLTGVVFLGLVWWWRRR